MGLGVLLSVASALIGAAGAPNSSDTIFYVLGAALMGGLVPAAISGYRRWRRGPIEDEEIIGRIVHSQMSGMKDLLGEYRTEVEVTKRQLDEYRQQLNENTKELARAQVRISQLESELRNAQTDRERVISELAGLREQRDGLMRERDRLALEADKLRERIDRLEQFAREMHPREGD